jgi:hypothetical protein
MYDPDEKNDVSHLPREEVRAADISSLTKLIALALEERLDEMFKDMLQRLSRSSRLILTDKQRAVVHDVLDKFEPQYSNLVSEGKVLRGKEVVVNVGNKPLRPPQRRSPP